MHKVTGPKCECGHWLKAEHRLRLQATLRRYADILDRQPKPNQLHRCTRYPNCGALLMENERCYACNALPPGEWVVEGGKEYRQ